MMKGTAVEDNIHNEQNSWTQEGRGSWVLNLKEIFIIDLKIFHKMLRVWRSIHQLEAYSTAFCSHYAHTCSNDLTQWCFLFQHWTEYYSIDQRRYKYGIPIDSVDKPLPLDIPQVQGGAYLKLYISGRQLKPTATLKHSSIQMYTR